LRCCRSYKFMQFAEKLMHGSTGLLHARDAISRRRLAI
jgi:hypothetical protein